MTAYSLSLSLSLSIYIYLESGVAGIIRERRIGCVGRQHLHCVSVPMHRLCRVQGLGFRGFGVWGLGFGVQTSLI